MENDVIIMFFPSTAFLEAVIMKKPVIYFNITKDLNNEYMNEEVINHVSKCSDLIEIMDQIVENPKRTDEMEKTRERFILRHLTFDDGNSSKRVAKIIDSIYTSR